MTTASVGILVAVLLGLGVFVALVHRTAVGVIGRKAAVGERKVLRTRLKLFRSPFAQGLTPLAMVYRVTTQAPDSGAKVKLYAYDPGLWLSRRSTSVRQFSGGVWRDA